MSLISEGLASLARLLDLLREDLEGLWIFAIFAVVLSIAERLRPADRFEGAGDTGSDVVYSVIENLGLSGLLLYFVTAPVMGQASAALEFLRIPSLQIDAWLAQAGTPALAAFVLQLFLFDGLDTLRHRIEHRTGWLWAFHSVHHSQTRMQFWTFDRNHVCSLLFNALCYAAMGRFLGIALDSVVWLLVAVNFMEYLTHANLRLSYGRLLDRVFVCPLYHRVHHAAELDRAYGPYGCNFANLFPIWDVLLGSADFRYERLRTGIEGQPAEQAGRGWLAHQRSGFLRFAEALRPAPAKRPEAA